LAADINPLNYNNIPRISGWSIVIFAIALPILLVLGVRITGERGMLGLLTVFFVSGLIAVAVAVAPMRAWALPALGFRHAGWGSIVLGSLIALLISVAVTQLGIEPEGIKQAMEVAREPAAFLASLAVMAGLAPLVEESVFRGLLYGWLAGRWGGAVAWIVSSLAFAAAHMELAHIILVLPLGLWFGWLRWRTGSLWPSLVAHVMNNALAVAAAALLPD